MELLKVAKSAIFYGVLTHSLHTMRILSYDINNISLLFLDIDYVLKVMILRSVEGAVTLCNMSRNAVKQLVKLEFST